MQNRNTPQLRISNFDVTSQLGYHQQNILQTAGVTAIDYQGNDITSSVMIDDRQVDYDHPGLYRAMVSVQDAEGNYAETPISVNVVRDPGALSNPNARQNIPGANMQPPYRTKRRHYGWLWALLAVVVIVVGWGFWTQVQQKNAALSDASSQSSKASSLSSANNQSSQTNDKLKNVNDGLKQEVSDLKQTVTDYKNTNDRQQFTQKMDQLQSQNQTLQNQIQALQQNSVTQALSKTVSGLSDSMDKISQAQTADQANDALNNANINNTLDGIKDQISNIKSKLGL
ncbi:hypothetical protein [Pediococcus argentinicus]|uniref:DUF5011 domain-containing protein n=1 Tax=Pediococcus argentinicus TaxID=480391 RepID=A0A0R2NI93_9LACO|nr:hypothetical protein [Pediococcus argentinicus]KRO25513.1 hypothetical protein IV88_GL001763 [Pediococcus argentinicus]NKZ22207.1 hypothetical protein [Pediococcus argentinicus]GEP19256.1 hypothetical protein LSA03_06400 [Pediococcus argentinicus]